MINISVAQRRSRNCDSLFAYSTRDDRFFFPIVKIEKRNRYSELNGRLTGTWGSEKQIGFIGFSVFARRASEAIEARRALAGERGGALSMNDCASRQRRRETEGEGFERSIECTKLGGMWALVVYPINTGDAYMREPVPSELPLLRLNCSSLDSAGVAVRYLWQNS